MVKTKVLAAPQPKQQKIEEPPSKQFQMICHDMYKAFGGCFNNLKSLCKSDEDRYLLSDQLHQLRNAVRQLLQEAKDTP